MKTSVFLVFLCVFCKIAGAQSVTTGQDSKAPLQDSARLRKTRSEALLQAQLRAQQLEIEFLKDRVNGLEATVGALKSRGGITINPTNGAVPVRSSSTTFADSPLSVDIDGNLEIGSNHSPDSTDGKITMVVGNTAASRIIEHNNYATGLDLYTHADGEGRAPYIHLLKSRGTQSDPTPVMFTGYELDSIGGIDFGGWDGAQYFDLSAAILTQTDENWDDTHHGGHLSVYATNPGSGNTPQQIAQFGGVDPNANPVVGNIIFYRPLTWGNNAPYSPGLFPGGDSRPPVLHVRAADGSADADLTAETFIETGMHTPSSAFDTGTPGQIAWDPTFVYICVAPNTWKRSALSAW